MWYWWVLGGLAAIGALYVVSVALSLIYIIWRLLTNPDG